MKRAWTWAKAASFTVTVTILGACGGGGGGGAGSPESAAPPAPAAVHGSCGAERDICLAGTYRNVLDSDTEYLWNCDGSNGGRTAMCSLPKLVVCPNGAPAAENPLLCRRGGLRSQFHDSGHVGFMVAGIDRLPLDRVQLTNKQAQQHFAIIERDSRHAQTVGVTACRSYVTASEGCELHEDRAGITLHPEGDEETQTGLTPFTQILDLRYFSDERSLSWEIEQVDAMRNLRILNFSVWLNQEFLDDGDRSYLVVFSAGNNRSDDSRFTVESGTYSQGALDAYAKAIAANKLLFVAGIDRDVHNDYIRHNRSSGCKGMDYGCLWAPFIFFREQSGIGGTSHSAPNVAASLASILSIFPDTSHQDLAKLARACAKKTGEGIDGPNGLLATSGGFGVADFSCMDEITEASADLSEDETVTLTIDDRQVVVSSRSIAVTEP